MSMSVSEYFDKWLKLITPEIPEIKEISKITQNELDRLKSYATCLEKYMDYLSELVSEDKIRILGVDQDSFESQDVNVSITLEFSVLETNKQINKENK